MSRAVAAVFATLVVATFGAFFVAQNLKNAPAVVQGFFLSEVISPNGDGARDRAFVKFRLKRADRVTVAMIDDRGDEVAAIADDVRMRAYRTTRFIWNGRTDAGARAPDGIYRVRITLREEGRSVIVRDGSVRVDNTPPRPRVISIGPDFASPGAELLPIPGGGSARVTLALPGSEPVVRVFKTSPGPTRLVLEDSTLGDDQTRWEWNGRTRSGNPVSPGTYLVSVQTRDAAGNVGTSPQLGRDGLPRAAYAQRLPGRGGITVRYLGVQPPATPVQTGRPAEFGVDARGQPWSWSIRRVGSSVVLRRGSKTSGRLRVLAPGRRPGVMLLTVRTQSRSVTVPFAVRAPTRASVLVVLPAITWQGRNPVDDDGDGEPNLLDRGLPARLARVYGGDGLPAGFATREAPLLAWLSRTGRNYDVTTDAALARGAGPRLRDYRGVLLPSDARWLPRRLQTRLRSFVRNGGALASFGVDALRREVTLTPGGRLVSPTTAASVDLFGARLRSPTTRASSPVTLLGDRDELQLFVGGAGSFGPFRAYQEADGFGSSARLLASAVVEQPQTGRPVIAATRNGRGLMLRLPLPELPSRLSSRIADAGVTALMERLWTLLSR